MAFRIWYGAACALALALTAAPAIAAPAATVLSLAETASVSVPPDELVAELRVTAEAPAADQAQAEVNRAMAAALMAARAVAGVTVATAGYATWQHPPGSPGGGAWQASQGLTLTSREATALLRLVGRLQGQGLAVGSLAWELSPPAREKAREAATQDALRALRGRAEQAAHALGLRFGAFRTVALGPAPDAAPRPLFASALRAEGPPPSAVAMDVTVTATVSAEVLLLAGNGATGR